MQAVRHIVDNRVFLLALDHLYREAMKRHERAELLSCARQVALALSVTPAAMAVEGYYAEDAHLAEYFRLVRTLQRVDQHRRSEVAGLPAFRRLEQVMSGVLYGSPQHQGNLLPVGRDSLSQGLINTRPFWTIPQVTAAAHAAARETDDISLVGLAARAEDPVALTALRESAVLYAEQVWLAAERQPNIEWHVDEALAELAGQFVDAFNTVFGEHLPAPTANEAERYWRAYENVTVVGRCVHLGYDDTGRHYHWAICQASGGKLGVHEFWHREIWTTTRFRAGLPANDHPDS